LLPPCAIEYAAQAMALHGALIGAAAGSPATPGYLASARGVRLHRLRLDDLAATCASRHDAAPAMHARSLHVRDQHAGEPVADGRATVVLNTPLADR
jgi:predicted hotdog family 3-hydroxylacyl-ACP dehydratase